MMEWSFRSRWILFYMFCLVFNTKEINQPIVPMISIPTHLLCLRDLPSQVIIGPGSNPSSQVHSNPPITFLQVPFPQGLPTEHSSVSASDQEYVQNMMHWDKMGLDPDTPFHSLRALWSIISYFILILFLQGRNLHILWSQVCSWNLTCSVALTVRVPELLALRLLFCMSPASHIIKKCIFSWR